MDSLCVYCMYSTYVCVPLSPRYQGVMSLSPRYQGVMSLSPRYKGVMSLSPRYQGEGAVHREPDEVRLVTLTHGVSHSSLLGLP